MAARRSPDETFRACSNLTPLADASPGELDVILIERCFRPPRVFRCRYGTFHSCYCHAKARRDTLVIDTCVEVPKLESPVSETPDRRSLRFGAQFVEGWSGA